MKMIAHLPATSLICAGLGLLVLPARADRTRSATADNLNVTTAWTTGVAPAAGDIALWDASSTLANTLGANLTWGGLNLTSASGAVTIGGANSLTLANSTAANTLLNVGSNNLTYGSSGAFNMGSATLVGGTFAGSSTVTLGGAGTKNWQYAKNVSFTGTLVLRGGTGASGAFSNNWLALSGTLAAGTTQTDSFALDSGASLTDRGDLVLTGAWGDGTTRPKLSLSSLTGYGDFRSDWDLAGLRVVSVNQSTDTTFNGRIVENNTTTRQIGLEKLGSGTLTLAGSSTYSGGTTIRAGTVKLGHGFGAGKSGTYGGQVSLRGGTFDINGQTNYANTAQTSEPSWLSTATLVLGGVAGTTMEVKDSSTATTGFGIGNAAMITYDATNNPGPATIAAFVKLTGTSVSSTRAVNVGDSTATDVEIDFTGGLSNTSLLEGKQTTLQKTGLGTMRISSANALPGLRVTAGRLIVNHANALGAKHTWGGGINDENILTIDGGILDLNGFSPAAGSLTDGGVTTGLVTNNGADASVLTVGSSNASTTFGGPIQNGTSTTGLTKTGTGTLTLTGTGNTYTGPTTVNNGVLAVSGTYASAMTVGTSGRIAPAASTVGTLTVPSLTMNAGGAIQFDFDVATNDEVTISDAAGLSLNGGGIYLYQVGTTNAFTTNGTYTLFHYNGSIAGSIGNLTVLNPTVGKNFILTDDSANQRVLLTISNATIEWTQAGGGLWSASSSWGGLPGPNGQSAFAGFTGSVIGGAATADLDIGITLGGLTIDSTDPIALIDSSGLNVILFNNGVANAGISASSGSHSMSVTLDLISNLDVTVGAGATLSLLKDISGTGTMTKSGAGTLVLAGANTFAAPLTISAGRVEIGNGATTGTLPGNVTDNGVLAFNRSDSLTCAGVVSGTGSLVVSSGTVILEGANSYTGGTTVNAGALQIGSGGASGDIGGGAVVVASGATLTFNRDSSALLDYKTNAKMRNVSGAGSVEITGGVTLFNYPGTGVGFAETGSWNNFTGNLVVKGGSEFRTIRNGATALGTGTVVLGDATTNGSLAQIEGNWTWTNPISLVGADNKIINRSTNPPRLMKVQGVISGVGGLRFQDAAATMNDANLGFILTGASTLTGTLTIDAGVPLRLGGVPGNVDVNGTGRYAGTSGSLGAAIVVNNGTLTFSRTDAHTVSNAISGTGAIRVGIPAAAALGDTTTQVVTYSGVGTWTGNTTVNNGVLKIDATGSVGATPTAVSNGGTLSVDGTFGGPSATVTVASGGTLSGTGTVASAVSLTGNIAPGNGVGTLSVTETVTWHDGARYKWSLASWGGAAGVGADLLAANSLDIQSTATPTTIEIVPESIPDFAETNQTYVIAQTTGGILPTPLTAGLVTVEATAFNAATGATGTWSVQVNGTNLELVYTAPSPLDAYNNWLATNYPGLTGADRNGDADPDHDGLPNAVEFVTGSDPTSGTGSDKPTVTTTPTELVFTFHRTDASEAAGITVVVQYGSNLSGWTDVPVGATSAGLVTVTEGADPAPDLVQVAIPRSGSKVFARLSVTVPAPTP